MRASTRVIWTVSVLMLAAVSEAIFPLPFLPFLPGFNNGFRENGVVKAAKPQPVAAAGKGGRKRGGAIEAQTKWPGQWEIFLQNSGVSAMHAILMPVINKVQFYDATIWRISKIKLPPGVPCHVVDAKTNKIDCWAHSVLVDVNTGAIKPLAVCIHNHSCFLFSLVNNMHYTCLNLDCNSWTTLAQPTRSENVKSVPFRQLFFQTQGPKKILFGLE